MRDESIVTRGAKALLRTNQYEGFDCPGCAWPDRNPNPIFEFCENAVKAVAAEATAKRVTREFFAGHTVGELLKRVCFIHPEDLEKQGWLAGMWVDITSVWHDGERSM